MSTYTYNPAGQVASVSDASGAITGYTYDSATGNLISVSYPPNSDSGASPQYQYGRDSLRGTVNYTFDATDRAATTSLAGGPSAGYGYYSDGSFKTITWSPVSGQFQYNYTQSGQYGSITFPNGQHRDYNYDDQGRLTRVANIHPAASNLGTFVYGYDSPLLGQRTSMTSNLGPTNYAYDSNYQLTQATYPNAAPFNGEIDSWTYDNIGNRLTNTVSGVPANYYYYKNGSNPLNSQRLQSDGTTNAYTYDNNGNLTGDGTYSYTWDYENRLTGITGAGLTASYTYDYLGRRTSKTVNASTTTYTYDGQNLIAERGASVTDYVFGPAIDEPLAMSRARAVSYYAADGLGSIANLTDTAGLVQNSYVYDSWGAVKNQTGSLANSFGYTAREFAEAGLDFYRARYYNPGIGRFISEDPLRMVGELYQYGANNPITYTDPTGLHTHQHEVPGGKLDILCGSGNYFGCFKGRADLACDCYPVGSITCPKFKPLVTVSTYSNVYRVKTNDPQLNKDIDKAMLDAWKEWNYLLFQLGDRIQQFEEKEYRSYESCKGDCDDFVADHEFDLTVLFQ